jgi:hypothetical protein
MQEQASGLLAWHTKLANLHENKRSSLIANDDVQEMQKRCVSLRWRGTKSIYEKYEMPNSILYIQDVT